MSFWSIGLLIPSCAIGAGLFSFPIVAGLSGYMPGMLAIIITWIFSTFVGFIIADLAYMVHGEDIHFFSITERFLGKRLQMLTLFAFLFICYGSLLGYLDGILLSLESLGIVNIRKLGLLIMIMLIYLVNFDRHKLVRINNYLLPVIIAIFVYFSYLAACAFDKSLLTHFDPSKSVLVLPTLVTAFSYQLMIPSMSTMLNGDKVKLKMIILMGTSINCVVYLLWYTLMSGVNSVVDFQTAYQASASLMSSIPNSHTTLFKVLGNIFAILTLLTSFTSISISLKDYWNEVYMTKLYNALPIKWSLDAQNAERVKQLFINIMVFLPMYMIYILFNKVFLWAFSSTGGYGDAIAFGLIPVYMAYKAFDDMPSYPKMLYFATVVFFLIVFSVQLVTDVNGILCWLLK